MNSLGSTTFYYVLPILVSIIVSFGYRNRKTGILLFVTLLVLSLLRGVNVGGDTSTYMDYNAIQYKANLPFEFSFEALGQNSEVLYVLLNKIVYFLDLPTRTIIVVFALVSFLFLNMSCKRLNCNLAIFLQFYVLLSLYYFSLTAARQMCAVSILLYAYSQIIVPHAKTATKFVIYIIIASLIHSSCWIFIITYFFRNINLPRNFVAYLIYPISACLILSGFSIMAVLLSYTDLEYIAHNDVFSGFERSFVGRLFFVLVITALLLIYKNFKKCERTDINDNLFLFSIVLTALFANENDLLSRVCYNIQVFQCVYLTWYFQTKKRGFFKGYIYIVISVLLIYNSGQMGSSQLGHGYYLMFSDN